MKVGEFDRDKISISLTYDEIYILIQCMSIVHNEFTDDVNTLVGVSPIYLDDFASRLNELKESMRPDPPATAT